MLALAQEMVSRGHVVTFLSQPSVRSRAIEAGSRFVAFDQIASYAQRKTIEEQIELAAMAITGVEIGEQLLAVASNESVDAVVLDCNLAGAAAAAETLAVPSALLFHSMFATFTDVWFADLWPFLAPAINETRNRFGLDPTNSWIDGFARHDLLISVVPPSFDASAGAVPDPLRHFGFLVPSPMNAAATTADFPAGDEPTVLVSLSTTYQHQERLLGRILGALGARAVRGLLTTAGQVDAAQLPQPANVTVCDYVPHGRLLGDTDVLITHAGLGTVAAGLSRGVPLVCIPLGRDQPLNARRVADVGAGIALATDASARQIGAAVDEILSNPKYAESARAIASESARSGGAAAAVDDLESLLHR